MDHPQARLVKEPIQIFYKSSLQETGRCESPMEPERSCFRHDHRPMVEDYTEGKKKDTGCFVYVTFNRRSNGSTQGDIQLTEVLKDVLRQPELFPKFIGFHYRPLESNFVIRMWMLIPWSDRKAVTDSMIEIWGHVFADSRLKSKLTETFTVNIRDLGGQSLADYGKAYSIATSVAVDLTGVVLAHLSLKGFMASLLSLMQLQSITDDPLFGRLFATKVAEYKQLHLELDEKIASEVTTLLIKNMIIGANTRSSSSGIAFDPENEMLELYWRVFYDVLRCLIELKLTTPRLVGQIYTEQMDEYIKKAIEHSKQVDSERNDWMSTAIAYAIRLYRCDLGIRGPLTHLVEYIDGLPLDTIPKMIGCRIARVFFGELCFYKHDTDLTSSPEYLQDIGTLVSVFMFVFNVNDKTHTLEKSTFFSVMKNSLLGEDQFISLGNQSRKDMAKTGRYPHLDEAVAPLLTPIKVNQIVPKIPEPPKSTDDTPKESRKFTARSRDPQSQQRQQQPPQSQQRQQQPPPQLTPINSGRFSGLKPPETQPITQPITIIRTVRTTTSTTQIQQSHTQMRACGNCGMTNHPTRNCHMPPKDQQQCHKCGRTGHIAPVCSNH